MTDPIADLLTRLRNGSRAKLEECVMPHSKLKASLAGILKSEGYINDAVEGTDERGHKTLVVKMKYVGGTPALTGLKRVSTTTTFRGCSMVWASASSRPPRV